ncbi:MAG: MnhB domain-containing protein [Bacillota bacterium]|nr:MnhB domain-containing protein [Bacillota bacterium]
MDDYITKIVFRYVLLLVLLYGFYIVLHGHLSPGGGFAGGMVIGMGMLLYFLIFGVEWKAKKLRRLPMDVALVFIGIGGFMEGLKFLLPHEHGPVGMPGTLFSVGIISVVNFGIGLLVASTILSIFYLLVEEA